MLAFIVSSHGLLCGNTVAQRRFCPTRRSICPSRRKFHAASNVKCELDIKTFDASDFELTRVIGVQNFATITDWTYYTPAPFAETRTTEPSAPAIRLYDARIVGYLPDMYNTRVILKEFLPNALELGVNEAEVYKTIYSVVADETDRRELPIASLLGTFLTDESFDTAVFKLSWQKQFPRFPNAPSSQTPFLVFAYEGLLTPLDLIKESIAESTNKGLFRMSNFSNLFKRKAKFILAFLSKCLVALQYMHGNLGLVHRSIGLASIMMNTMQWSYASSLEVKFRDFAFAKQVSQLAQGEDLERARRAEAFTPSQIAAFYFAEDVNSLGYAFTELIFSMFANRPITQDTFKKLFEDTFDFNLEAARDYCAQDPDWGDAVKFLDTCNGNGWELLFTMLKARKDYTQVSLQTLSESPFLDSRF